MAAGSTYTKIAVATPSGASTIAFNSITGSYTDLILVLSVSVGGSSGGTMYFQTNDTGSNYSFTTMGGDGSTASSSRGSSTNQGLVTGYIGGVTASQTATILMNFLNYSNTTTYKTILSRGNSSGSVVDASVSLWRSTGVIDTIYVYMSGSRTLTGTATLYGILAA